MDNIFRNLPSISQLLESPQLKKLVETLNHNVVVDGARNVLDDLREQINSRKEEIVVPTASDLADKISNWLTREETRGLRPVINGTGTILHTGLGRAPLAKSAINAVREISAGYASVEIDIATGERSQRANAVDRMLRELTGAQAGIVVNNNAAATMVVLAALAGGKKVLVSRGELIEIGGSYRLPDVMEMSGAKLHEVGTTNKTRLQDYQNGITAETGAILKVHTSNFRIVGFTEDVSVKQLVPLANQHRIPLIDDLGSGALFDFSKYGLSDEPVVRESIRAGSDVVLFSGDKLLGGPQCGIIVGRKELIKTILDHPMMRALRVDKMTLAALAETLRLYRNMETAEQEIPVLRMLSMPVENLKLRATKVVQQISHLSGLASFDVVEDYSMLGGGSLPTQKILTWCVSVQVNSGSIEKLAERLRSGHVPILSRVSKDRLLLDMRTIFPEQDSALVDAFEAMPAQA